MKHFVIRGASGYIGGTPAKRLFRKGHIVCGLGRSFKYCTELLNHKNFIPVELVFGDEANGTK